MVFSHPPGKPIFWLFWSWFTWWFFLIHQGSPSFGCFGCGLPGGFFSSTGEAHHFPLKGHLCSPGFIAPISGTRREEAAGDLPRRQRGLHAAAGPAPGWRSGGVPRAPWSPFSSRVFQFGPGGGGLDLGGGCRWKRGEKAGKGGERGGKGGLGVFLPGHLFGGRLGLEHAKASKRVCVWMARGAQLTRILWLITLFFFLGGGGWHVTM